MADLFIHLLLPSVFTDAEAFAYSQVYLRAINERLSEYLYPAGLSGMSFGVYAQPRGFTLRLSGFSDKFVPLLERVLNEVRDAHHGELRLSSWRDQQRQAWEFDRQQAPYLRSQQIVSRLLVGSYWREQALSGYLGALDQRGFTRFAESIWADAYIEALAHGNFSQDMLDRVAQLLEALPNCGCDGQARQHIYELKLAPGAPSLQVLNAGHHTDRMVHWVFQAPSDSLRDEALMRLSARLLNAPFFAALRTEQQLGYVAQVSYQPGFRWPALHFQVQSPRASEVELVAAVREFIDELPVPSEFQATRDAMVAELRTSDPQTTARSFRFWESLRRGDIEFSYRQELARKLSTIDEAQWRAFIERLLGEAAASLMITTLPQGVSPDDLARNLSARLLGAGQSVQGYY